MVHGSEDWIMTVTEEARSRHPEVAEKVRATLGKALNGPLSDSKLSSGNLGKLAKELLAEQGRQQPDTEEAG